MSNYYEKRDAKVRIAEELSNMGWKIYGYKEDQSDSMTDYYSPSDWDGIATKNGYVLVVDNKYCNNSGKEITKYNPNYVAMSSADQTKIESLKNMTTSNGATTGEEENAQKLIEKLQSKYSNQTESRWEVIGHFPTYMNTTKGSIWHLEKDGALADKGNKLTIFDDMPDSREFDINTMEFKGRYKEQWTGDNEDGSRIMEARQLTESERKAVNEFKSFILRIERIANFGNSCGDGTKETEEAFQQQNESEKMVKKIFTTTKKVIKPVQVQKDTIKVGDYVNYKGNRATYCYWKVININEERKTFTYEATGKKYQDLKNGKRYYNNLNKLNELYDIFELQEVEEVETVEKWVKVKATKTTTTKKETVKTEAVAEDEEEVKTEQTENNINVEFEVVEDIHTKTQEKIYVAKITERVEKDVFMTILSKIKKLGGYYYKYKGGFIFNESPTELLKNNFSQSAEQQEKNIIDNEIDLESVAGYIVDNSGDIIESLNLSKVEYWNNLEYKEKLLQVIKDRQLTKNQFKSVIDHIEQHEEYKEYKRLIEVLKGFYSLDNEVKIENKNNSDISSDREKNIIEPQEEKIIINEDLAKRSKENMSFSDYKEGSATQSYNNTIENMAQKINEAKEQIKDDSEKQLQLDYLLTKFKKDYANWTNKHNANGSSHVSWMISGRGNYNMNKHNKWEAKEGKLWAEYNDIMAIEDKIDKIIYSKKIIKSDDKDALEKLRKKLEQEQKEHDNIVNYNKQARKENKEVYSTYVLQNSNQRIKNIKDRISHLEKLEELKTTQGNTEIEINNIKIIDNLEANRVQMIFPNKPNEDIRKILKSNGFRYSYTFGAWQRNRNAESSRKAKSIAEELKIDNVAV